MYILFSYLINPIILYILLYFFAGKNADLEFIKIFFVSLGIGIGGTIILMILTPVLGYLSIIPVVLFSLFLLKKYCYVTFRQGVIIMLVFILIKIGMNKVFFP